MILDKIENLKLYSDLNDNFSKVIEFLKANNIEKLEQGRYDIDGSNLFVLIQNYETKSEDEARWESHKNYIDIQYLISGTEIIGWAPTNKLPIKEKYSEEKDVAFYSEAAGTTKAVLNEGYFAVFFPQDAHKPGCIYKNPEMVKKMVVKIKK